MHDTLKDRRVVFTVWVNLRLYRDISLGLIHVTLNIDDFLKNGVNVALSMFYGIEEDVTAPQLR